MFSDSHCHVDLKSDDTIARAVNSGVELILASGIDLPTSSEAVQVAKRHPSVRACVGIHPWNADQYSGEALKRIEELAESTEVVAISEIGLDYVGRRNREGKYVNEFIEKHVQQRSFLKQLKLAKGLRLPVIVHDRTPAHEVLDIIEEMDVIDTGVAIHGFSKDLAYARRCVDLGIYLSIGPRTLLAPENEAFRDVVKQILIDFLLTETDSANPEGVVAVAEKIGELKGVSSEEVGRMATVNLKRLLALSK